MFDDSELSHDAFLCGKFKLWQPIRGYRAATDPVLLAAACNAKPGQSVLDLGCGVGAASFCLGSRVAGLRQFGLELQSDYAALARRNALDTGIALSVTEGDIQAMPAELRIDFDHVIANPPYYRNGSTPSPIAGRATAMQVDAPLEIWVAAAARRLAPGGWLTLICGADGLPAVLSAMGTKLGSASVLPLTPRDDHPALRILLRARKGGRAAFRLLSPLVIHQGPAHAGDRESYTTQANAVLRGGESLDWAFA
jgi:tRNA1Val (adenine37-N6)-methyltransferase